MEPKQINPDPSKLSIQQMSIRQILHYFHRSPKSCGYLKECGVPDDWTILNEFQDLFELSDDSYSDAI